jgi:predicted DNA-binding transcriptional regulator AlpA
MTRTKLWRKLLSRRRIHFVDTTTTTRRAMADPKADYWTISDVAEHWGVSEQTIRTYRSRGRGELPPEDRLFGRSPAWRPATILNFQRPGKGARTDLRRTPEADA